MTKGERIKALRDKCGMKQTELADKINVSKQSLYKYENDIITNIPFDKIEQIANILHTTPSYIMGWDNIPGKIDKESAQGHIDKTLPDPDALAIKMYKSLDSGDKAEIRGEMKHMLKAEKYTEKY